MILDNFSGPASLQSSQQRQSQERAMSEKTVMGFVGCFIALVIVCLAAIALRFTWFVVVDYPGRPDASPIRCEAKP